MMYELAMHPDVQIKLRNEILETLEKTNGEITYQMVRYHAWLASDKLLIYNLALDHYANLQIVNVIYAVDHASHLDMYNSKIC